MYILVSNMNGRSIKNMICVVVNRLVGIGLYVYMVDDLLFHLFGNYGQISSVLSLAYAKIGK